MSTVFIIKPKVAGMMTMTQCLSSCDPTDKSSISHSYVFMSSSEDAGVEHSGDIHWVPGMVLDSLTRCWMPPLWCLWAQLWGSTSSTIDRSRYPFMSPFLVHTSHTARSPWMISVPTFSCRGTPSMESLIWILVWHRLYLWIPILRSHPTRAIMWSLTRLSLPTLQWFAWLLIRLLLLQLRITLHPRSMVVGTFVLALCPVDMGVLEEEDVVTMLLVVSAMVTSRLTVDLDSACRAEHEDSPFWL